MQGKIKNILKKTVLLLTLGLTCVTAVSIGRPQEVQAADHIYKNKTFYVYAEHAVTIQSWYSDDTIDGDKKLEWNGRGYGTIEKPVDEGIVNYNGKQCHKYRIKMVNVDVKNKTPYIEIRAYKNKSDGYYPVSARITASNNDNGCNVKANEYKQLEETLDASNKLFAYIGYSFTGTEMEVKFQECTYNVKYKISKGKGDSSTTKNVPYTKSTTLHKAPTRYGYNFTGWYCAYTNQTYNAGASFYPGKYDMTKFAPYGPEITMTDTWEPKEYTITYNKNKPSNASNNVTGNTASNKLKYESWGKLTKNGYSLKGWYFTGWNTKADGSGESYSDEQQVNTVNSGRDTTLYAQWKQRTYNLHLNSNYAVSAGTADVYEHYDDDWYSENPVKNRCRDITIPAKTGCKFEGYYTSKDGGTRYINSSGHIEVSAHTISSDTEVYAHWSPAIYKVHLDREGGSNGTTDIWEKFGIGYYSNSNCSSGTSKISVPTKTHYKFKGYYTEQNTADTSNGQRLIDENGNIVTSANTMFTSDSTIYAKWEPVDYTISLNNQGADMTKGSDKFYEKYGKYNYTEIKYADSSKGNTTKTYGYTGNVQTFIAPYTGTYTLEVAGAQGGTEGGEGGKGGKSTGNIKLNEGDMLYIYVGQAGTASSTGWYDGGYNGGGGAGQYGATGGGATHIAKIARGELLNYKDHKNDVLIVAGGGGAGSGNINSKDISSGGSGGGIEGGSGGQSYPVYKFYIDELPTGGTQSKGGHYGLTHYVDHDRGVDVSGCNGLSGDFGRGANASNIKAGGWTNWGCGGGGGWYGGGSTAGHGGAGGGSGYIGGVSNGSMTNGYNSGNGWCKITYTNYSVTTSSSTHITVPQRLNYTFNGYWTGTNGTGDLVIDKNGNIATKPTYFGSNATVYAAWNRNSVCTVTYEGNGGLWNGRTSWRSGEYHRGSSYRIENNFFSRTGYHFTGWSGYSEGQNITLNSNLIIYAQWAPNTVNYTVKYYKQNLDGTYNDLPSVTAKRTATADSSIWVSPSSSEMDMTGFEIEADKTYSSPAYSSKSGGSVYTKINPDSSTVVKFYYKRRTYSLNLHKGTGISSVTGAETYKYGQKVIIDAEYETGYKWKNWVNTGDGRVVTSTKNYSFNMPAYDLDYTATAKVSSYNLTIIPLAESDTGRPLVHWCSVIYNKGDCAKKSLNYNETFEIERPVREGYNFTSWTINNVNDNGETVDTEHPTVIASIDDGNGGIKDILTMGSQDAVITAGWAPKTDTTYTVNHWFQNVNSDPSKHDSNNYTLDDDISGPQTGSTDSYVTPRVYTICDGSEYYGFYSPDPQEVRINSDGSTVVNYYYERASIDIVYSVGKNDRGDKKGQIGNSAYKSDGQGLIYKSADNSLVTTSVDYGSFKMGILNADDLKLSLRGYDLEHTFMWKNEKYGIYLAAGNMGSAATVTQIKDIINGYYDEARDYMNQMYKDMYGTNWSDTDWDSDHHHQEFLSNRGSVIRDYIKNSLRTGRIQVEANWYPLTYEITLAPQKDKDDTDTPNGTEKIYELYDHGYYTDPKCDKKDEITSLPQTAQRRGYTLEGYFTKVKPDEDEKASKGDKIITGVIKDNYPDKPVHEDNTDIGKIIADSNYFDKDTTIYAHWRDIDGPDKSTDKTYIQAVSGSEKDNDLKTNKVYAKATAEDNGTAVTDNKNSITFYNNRNVNADWTTEWINKKLYIDFHSFDSGSGIKTLLTRNSVNNDEAFKDWKTDTFNPTIKNRDARSYKLDATDGTETFYGIATDRADNPLETKTLTTKIDTVAPEGTYTIKTGTLKAPVNSDYYAVKDASGNVISNKTGTSLNADDLSVNNFGMGTELVVTADDPDTKDGYTANSVSGIKYVWMNVCDAGKSEDTGKSYLCHKIPGTNQYIAVQDYPDKTKDSNTEFDMNRYELPNLYTEFKDAASLKIKVYVCDEAGNVTDITDNKKAAPLTPEDTKWKDPEPDPVNPDNGDVIKKKNISIWSRIERDDKNSPVNRAGEPYDAVTNEDSGPKFLLGQSGKVHIVTYGYVDSIDADFLGSRRSDGTYRDKTALQKAAMIDVAKNQSLKPMGTVDHFSDGAVFTGFLNGLKSAYSLDDTKLSILGNKAVDAGPIQLTCECLRKYDYVFSVPLYLGELNVDKLEKGLNESNAACLIPDASNWTKDRLVYDDTVIHTTETAHKGTADDSSNSAFYCGTDRKDPDKPGDNDITKITDRLRTHLIN